MFFALARYSTETSASSAVARASEAVSSMLRLDSCERSARSNSIVGSRLMLAVFSISGATSQGACHVWTTDSSGLIGRKSLAPEAETQGLRATTLLAQLVRAARAARGERRSTSDDVLTPP